MNSLAETCKSHDSAFHRPIAISLFAGAGGCSLGFQQAGYDIRLATDIDADAVESYRRNFGKTPCEAADAAIQTVRALSGKAGLPASLREIGVQLPQLDAIARNALDDAYIVTNPRPVREEDARAICQAAW